MLVAVFRGREPIEGEYSACLKEIFREEKVFKMPRTMLLYSILLLCLSYFIALPHAGLGADTKPEAPVPDWLARLFPHTGVPDHLEHRLRRVSAVEQTLNGHTIATITVELSYPDMYGHDHTGQARIYLPPLLRDNPKQRVPLIHNAGYEIDEKQAAGLVARGYAVCTPHAEPVHPLCRNMNLDTAILHSVRGLSCIDPLRVSIQGGSAGGWMTLLLTADAFPLECSMPDVPLIHFGYNIAYLEENRAVAEAEKDGKKPNMPYLAAVSTITEQVRPFYGMPYESATYFGVSPLGHIDTITAPTLVTFSTADILVPIDQVGAKLVQKREGSLFPQGYSSSMSDRFPGIRGKRTLLQALSSRQYDLFRVSPPSTLPRIKFGEQPSYTTQLAMPFSKEKPWSILVIEEGAIEPSDAHAKYVWGLDHEPFRKWAGERGVTADQLTPAKLQRLMKRMQGEPWLPIRVRPKGEGEERAGNQLDYPEAERADVLLGLRAFASEDTRAIHLGNLYARLPAKLKVLGRQLGKGAAQEVRDALEKFATTQRGRTS